ncbi:MAG: hypothetical protein WA709_30160 [Stellaceae bacterium]
MKTKHLLGGVAVIAALALFAPVWAQPANPSGGNPVGLPGPNPGGPGLTPYSTGAPPSASASDTTSAMPPKHRHARAHHVVSTHQMLHAHGPKSGTDTTAQLNQAELARLQAGAPPMAPQMAPPPPMQGGNSMGMPGPNTGGPGLTPYSAGAPPR